MCLKYTVNRKNQSAVPFKPQSCFKFEVKSTMRNSHNLLSSYSCLDYVSSSKLNLQTFVFGRSPPHSFSTSVYLRDNTAANPLQGQYLY